MYCSQCDSAWYCGKSCQKQHWKQHKKACVKAVKAAKAAEAAEAEAAEAAAAAEGAPAAESPLPTIESFFKYRAERRVITLVPKELRKGWRRPAGCINPELYPPPDAATLSSWKLKLELSTTMNAKQILESVAERTIGSAKPLTLRLSYDQVILTLDSAGRTFVPGELRSVSKAPFMSWEPER